MTPAVTEFAEKIAATYGGTPLRAGREMRVFCPVHEGDGARHRPSLAIWSTPLGTPGFACLVGCKHADIRLKLRDKGILPPMRNPAHRAAVAKQEADALAEAIRRAKLIYQQSTEVRVGDPVDLYLRSRNIILTEDEAQFIRTSRGAFRGEWLMLSVIIDPLTMGDEDRRAVGIQQLKLDARGQPRVDERGKKYRRIFGRKRGCGVPLGTLDETCVVGEGVETTLAGMRLFNEKFGIAALSGKGIATLALPDAVKKVILLKDNDVAGDIAANEAAPLWRSFGIRVAVASWDRSEGYDAADEWSLVSTKGG